MSRDLHIQLIDPSAQTARALFTFGTTPLAVSGAQKLANRWLKVFMTRKGSHPTRHDEGTIFPGLVSGNVADLAAAEADILEAVDDATDQVRAQDRLNPTRPANERLISATVTQFVAVSATGVEFWVTLVNAARERIPVLIPYAPA